MRLSHLITFIAAFILSQFLNIVLSTNELTKMSSASTALKSDNLHTLRYEVPQELVRGYDGDDGDEDDDEDAGAIVGAKNEDDGDEDDDEDAGAIVGAKNEDDRNSKNRPTNIANHHKPTKCTLLAEDEAPTPVILMAHGRSGSSITWETLTQLTGKKNTAYEKNGHDPLKSAKFFNELKNNKRKSHQWAVELMCSIQKQHIETDAGNDEKSAIVGFQWKPHGITLSHEYSKKGLGAVGAQQDPPIRVIYLTRNRIDRKLSNLRHEEQNLEIPAHCEVGDEECLRQHEKSFEKGGIEFPVGKDLLLMLEGERKLDQRLRGYFNRYGVKYIHVEYEKLYKSDNADEWMRIFKFLGKGPSENLTMEEVRSAYAYAPTGAQKRNLRERIRNYDQVKKTLKGTKFKHFL